MHFPKIKLSLLAKITAGQNAPQNQADYGTEGYPFIKAAHMQALSQGVISEQECLRVSDAVARHCKLKISKAGSIVFAKSGMSCMKGYIHALAQDVYLVNHLACVTITASERLTSQYLLYYFRKHSPSRLAKDEGYPSISLSGISNLEIPLPPLAEQERIAAVLDAVAATLKKRQTQLAELNALVEARFVELFGDPSRETRFPTQNLTQLGELNRGVSKHRPRNAPELLGGPYPLIQTGDVANAELYIRSYQTTYSELGLAQSKLWKAGALCITIAANIAKTAILTFDACFPDSVVGFIPASEKTNAVFIRYWFAFFQKILEDQAPQVAQKNINLKILSELQVIVPPLELQERFAAEVERVEGLKTTVRAGIAETQTLFDALTQRYFG